jgi:uncharacterized protein
MLDVIEKLLILQDRDRAMIRLRHELAHIGPERLALQSKSATTTAALEAAKHQLKQNESDRKKLELEIEAKKLLIEKYSVQQFQTRKNEEYRALAHEIEGCKHAIAELEDQILELMERADVLQTTAAAALKNYEDAKRVVDKQTGDLGIREQHLQRELASLEKDRSGLVDAVEEVARLRYERLLKSKGEKALVGVAHSVCGGCHMKLPPQIILSCQGGQELVGCPNCGRLLFYSRDMDLTIAD